MESTLSLVDWVVIGLYFFVWAGVVGEFHSSDCAFGNSLDSAYAAHR